MRELTSAEAARVFGSRWWYGTEPALALAFQLRQERLCMRWEALRAACDRVLGRDVQPHHFERGRARRELLEELEAVLRRRGLTVDQAAELVARAVLEEEGATRG